MQEDEVEIASESPEKCNEDAIISVPADDSVVAGDSSDQRPEIIGEEAGDEETPAASNGSTKGNGEITTMVESMEEGPAAANNLDDENLCDKDADSDVGDDDDDAKENYEGFNGTGRTVTLQMLMSANVLQPGKSAMTIEYLGQKFVGDLLPDGKIKSQETETIFLTPSAWAMHCKRIINPEKKSGCGWASVKYKGKKLDAYKNSWLRKCAQQKESTPDDYDGDCEKKSDSPLPVIKRTVFPHNTISNRNIMHEANMLVEAVPFTAVGKLQPFHITISSSSLLLTDFHCHLTLREVCGYLGGTWDVNTHTLQVSKAYPCRNIRHDRQKAAEVEKEIQKTMLKDQLILVGWYHSHPQFQAEPTLRDCDSQLDYQIKMRGPSDVTYTPCVALIVSPYYDENPTLESVVKAIWVVPPFENKQSQEYGRPMLMQYTILPDKEVPEEVRNEIQSCVDYYSQFRNEIVRFRSMFNEDTTYIEKLKNTLYPKFPLKQNDKALWNWICVVLDCEQEDDFIPPKTIKIIDVDSKDDIKGEISLVAASTLTAAGSIEFKSEDLLKEETKDILPIAPMSTAVSMVTSSAAESITTNSVSSSVLSSSEQQKTNEMKILSLQEQLCLPSGLNMNPVRMLSPLATPNPTGTAAVAPVAPLVPPPNAVANSVTGNSAPTLPPIIPAPIVLPPAPLPVISATNFSSNSVNSSITPLPQPSVALPPVVGASNASQLPVLPIVSPRDSPLTIPSSSASPAKFEVPVRASPSPAKSDASSHTSRTRASPAPSPGKFSISDLARNSPNSNNALQTPQSALGGLIPPSAACLPTANDLMAASLAQLAQLPPSFLQSDIAAALFQQPRKDFSGGSTSTSLNQLAAAAAKAGSQKSSTVSSGGMSALQSNAPPDLSDPNVVAAAAAAFSNTFNLPPQTTPARSNKSERASSKSSVSSNSSTSSTSSNSYKTKLMKELDDLKNDPMKMSELMRSPEYAALLLQQAEALGATTLGTLGFGQDFSYLTGAGLTALTGGTPNTSSNLNANANSKQSKQSAAAASAAAFTADYNNLIQASKLLGYDNYMQQMGAAAAAAVAAASVPPAASPSSSKKQQQQQQQASQAAHPDYTALLQTYSKLLDPSNQFGAALSAPGGKAGAGNMHHELSALLAAGMGGMGVLPPMSANNTGSSGSKKAQQQHQQKTDLQSQPDMLNQLLQSEKQQSDLNAALMYHNKAAADLNALFASPSMAAAAAAAAAQTASSSGKSGGSSSGSAGGPSPLTDPAAYYNALAQEKIQDYAAFFQQQHTKYGSIPDPLSKSTLAANNLFMSPSALLKMQQESLSAMMMKPPKSTSSSSSVGLGVGGGSSGGGRNRESSASPALERLTPTKSAGKYNFSVVDLATSSVPSNTPSPAPSDGSNSSAHRRPSNTPPVDLSRLYGELAGGPSGALNLGALTGNSSAQKKRMEFSSIADLAAPPPAKISKTSDDVLNLSNE